MTSRHSALAKLFEAVRELEAAHPGRRFTPDGHLVGSIGEVEAEERYGLALHPASHKTHDGRAPDGREVQIKATFGTSGIAMRSEPEQLVVLRLQTDGSPAEEVYNGPGSLAWNACGRMQENGQRPISLSRLRVLMADVSVTDRVPSE